MLDKMHAPVKPLSGGMQRKLSLGIAFVMPSPATHWASLQLKAGETVCKTPFGSKTV